MQRGSQRHISLVLRKILTSPPFSNTIDTCSNAEAAISKLSQKRYDLVSLDYLLTGHLTGMDVYGFIRREFNPLPVIFVSGNLHFIESVKDLQQKDPFLDHMVKPFENMSYAAMIAKWLA